MSHHEHSCSTPPSASPEAFWDGFYQASERTWSGNPNHILVREATGLPPGTALDLGCGEGADAIWLALKGWRVTAVDVSRAALARAAGHAAAAGVTEAISWQHHDLAVSFPRGHFDLVSAQYLHSPIDMPRNTILRAAARAVAPGGTLLVAGHAAVAGEEQPHPDLDFPTPEEVLRSLDLSAEEWNTECVHAIERVPDGRDVPHTDNLLRARRR